jgi:hypothetical protein
VNVIRTRLTVAAGAVIIALTVAAFWLSYAHLHDVAATYGLAGSTARAWAWPATLDLFIVAGEIMMLVAALNKRRDVWAIGLTVAGSVGSIALNVLGVGQGAPVLAYVVAAVPPAAALLAFGALMRQLHEAVSAPAEATQEAAPAVVVEKVLEAPVAPAVHVPLPRVVEELEALETAGEAPEEDDQEDTVEAPEVVEVHRIVSKPSVEEIAAAVEDIQRDPDAELNGTALAAYFGVSPRSGRRYLNQFQTAS